MEHALVKGMMWGLIFGNQMGLGFGVAGPHDRPLTVDLVSPHSHGDGMRLGGRRGKGV